QGRRSKSDYWLINHDPVDATRTPTQLTPTCPSAVPRMSAAPFFSPCCSRSVGGSARRRTDRRPEVLPNGRGDHDGICDDVDRLSLATPTRQSSLRLSKIFCKDDGHETADDGGGSGGFPPEKSAIRASLASSSSTPSGAHGAGGGVGGVVGQKRRSVGVAATKDGQAGFLSRTAFAAMSVAAQGNDGDDSDDDCWDTVIDDEAGSLPLVAGEGGEEEWEACSSAQRTSAILADPRSPVLFGAENDYDRGAGAEVLIPAEGPGGVAVVACPPPRLIRFRTTPEGRVVASDAAVVPIRRHKKRGRGRQRRVRGIDVDNTAAASVSSRVPIFDREGSSSGGPPGRRGEATFDHVTQRQASGQGDGGDSSTPGSALKSPAPDANAANYRGRIPPNPARKKCVFEDKESDDNDDEMGVPEGGEGKNMEHKRTRSAPESSLPRPHAWGELGIAAYFKTLRQDGEQGKTHRRAPTAGTNDNSGGSPSRSLAFRNDGDTTSPHGTVPQPTTRGGATYGGTRSAPSSRRGSGTKRGGKSRGYTAVLGRLKGMLNLESKPRSPPVRRMSRMEMHKAYLIAERFRTPGGSPRDWSSPAGFDDKGYPEDGVLPGTGGPKGRREQVEGGRGGGRSTRAWRTRGRGAA
ncbi:unnamed protein product, partial [Ectocarpus fasciculatus]